VLLLGAVRAAVLLLAALHLLLESLFLAEFLRGFFNRVMAPAFHLFEGRPACRGGSGGILRPLLPAGTYAAPTRTAGPQRHSYHIRKMGCLRNADRAQYHEIFMPKGTAALVRAIHKFNFAGVWHEIRRFFQALSHILATAGVSSAYPAAWAYLK